MEQIVTDQNFALVRVGTSFDFSLSLLGVPSMDHTQLSRSLSALAEFARIAEDN